MDRARLKYRIVGSVVLVALAAIVVPLLSDLRHPLPHGPQAIDIPAEPADGVAGQLPADGTAPHGLVPEPQDVPLPLPAPAIDEEAGAASADASHESMSPTPSASQAQASPARSAAPATPVAAPPSARVEPVPPKPAVTKSVPVAKPVPAKMATTAPPPALTKPTVASKAPVAAPAPSPAPTKPTQAATAVPSSTPAPAPAAVKPAASAASPAAPAATSQQAWVVQLGVYGNLKTAIDLREQLRKAGHSAFTEEVVTPHGKALRVRVGPELDRATAQALRDRLVRETGHEGIVVGYP